MKTLLSKINPSLVVAIVGGSLLLAFIAYNMYIFFSQVTEHTGSSFGY